MPERHRAAVRIAGPRRAGATRESSAGPARRVCGRDSPGAAPEAGRRPSRPARAPSELGERPATDGGRARAGAKRRALLLELRGVLGALRVGLAGGWWDSPLRVRLGGGCMLWGSGWLVLFLLPRARHRQCSLRGMHMSCTASASPALADVQLAARRAGLRFPAHGLSTRFCSLRQEAVVLEEPRSGESRSLQLLLQAVGVDLRAHFLSRQPARAGESRATRRRAACLDGRSRRECSAEARLRCRSAGGRGSGGGRGGTPCWRRASYCQG